MDTVPLIQCFRCTGTGVVELRSPLKGLAYYAGCTSCGGSGRVLHLNHPKISRQAWDALSDEDKWTVYECARLRASEAEGRREDLEQRIREALDKDD